MKTKCNNIIGTFFIIVTMLYIHHRKKRTTNTTTTVTTVTPMAEREVSLVDANAITNRRTLLDEIPNPLQKRLPVE